MSAQIYEDRDSPSLRWLVLLVVYSLLAHVLLIAAVVLITHFMPMPKMAPAPVAPPSVSLTLQPPPPPPPQAPPKKRPFMPTEAQPNATPKNTLIESDNDVRLQSQSTVARNPNSVMPDVVSKHDHASDLKESPKVTSKQKPQQPAPQAPPQKEQPKEPPKETKTPQPTPQPTPPPDTKPNPSPAPKSPSKTPSPNNTPTVDPLTGLPVLPPINAQTIAQQTPTTQTPQPAAPPPVQPSSAENLQGRAGISGAPSPEAMKTELGQYKARWYRAVGSNWYPAINDNFQLIGVGMVRIRYTIYFDVRVETQVLDAGSSSLSILLTVSQNAIRKASPFEPFSDSMRRQVGDSYTDEFTFSVYGN